MVHWAIKQKLVIFFEVLMVVTMKITVIRDVMPWYFTQFYQHCGQTCHMNILPQRLREYNSNKSPTRCNNCTVYFLTFIYSSTCFGHFPAHHQELNDCSGSLWFYLRVAVTVVLCLWSGLPAVIELLMMGGKMPETCWAVNKRQKINWKIVASGWWFIWIVRWCTD